jgi:hypothetical protein
MEKNLNKYLTIEEASKQNYVTPQMINILVQNNRLPFFCDKGTVRVFPGDVAAAIGEMFGVEEKKKKKGTVPIPETPPEEIIVPAE